MHIQTSMQWCWQDRKMEAFLKGCGCTHSPRNCFDNSLYFIMECRCHAYHKQNEDLSQFFRVKERSTWVERQLPSHVYAIAPTDKMRFTMKNNTLLIFCFRCHIKILLSDASVWLKNSEISEDILSIFFVDDLSQQLSYRFLPYNFFKSH